MPSIHETAYPRLKASVTARDLAESYTPTPEEVTLATSLTRSETARACFVLLGKTFQRLGYFVYVQEVPEPIVTPITTHLGMTLPVAQRPAYDISGTRRRHVTVIRDYLHVLPYGPEVQTVLEQTIRDAAPTKEELADLSNVGIEELIRQRFELPGFTTLRRCAQRMRAAVNRELSHQVDDALGTAGRLQLDQLLTTDVTTHQTLWTMIKVEPGKPTLTQLRQLVARLHWLTPYNQGASALAHVPAGKVHHCATEAHSLDATRRLRMPLAKRYTYAAALVQAQVAQTLDDLGERFLKRMRSIHPRGEEALEEYRKRHQGRTEALITLLYALLTARHPDAPSKDRWAAMSAVVGDQTEAILTDCLAYTAYANNNYYPLLWPFYASPRQTLLTLLDQLPLRSTSQDTTVEEALAVLRTHRTTKRDWLDLSPTPLDLSWVSDKWWKFVTGTTVRTRTPSRVQRRHFEVCVFSQVMAELQSGDLCIPGSAQFADYRAQLISWEAYHATVAAYGAQVGLPVESTAFVTQMRTWLAAIATATDVAFPSHTAVRLVEGEPVLRQLTKRPTPRGLRAVEQRIAERIEPVNSLDGLTDTETWLQWTRPLGLFSGRDVRIDAARARSIATTFCYGCNLGPTQTAQSLGTFDRRQLAWIDLRHMAEDKLDAAITLLINA